MKRYVDSSKSKKASKSTKANTMKPQTATNGLKRPLPSTASVEDAKRLNLDSSATAINIKKEEVKSEPKSDTSDNIVATANHPNVTAANAPPVSLASGLNSEVKQESIEANANHSNNDVSLNDFVNDEVFDLENTDFQVILV